MSPPLHDVKLQDLRVFQACGLRCAEPGAPLLESSGGSAVRVLGLGASWDSGPQLNLSHLSTKSLRAFQRGGREACSRFLLAGLVRASRGFLMLESSHSDLKRFPRGARPTATYGALNPKYPKNLQRPQRKTHRQADQIRSSGKSNKKSGTTKETDHALCRSLPANGSRTSTPKYAKTAAFGAKPAGPEAFAGTSHPPPLESLRLVGRLRENLRC